VRDLADIRSPPMLAAIPILNLDVVGIGPTAWIAVGVLLVANLDGAYSNTFRLNFISASTLFSSTRASSLKRRTAQLTNHLQPILNARIQNAAWINQVAPMNK